MPDPKGLVATLAGVAGLATRFAGKGITEQDTKHALIAPVLEALGWSMTDLDAVRAEYRHVSRDNPVDYALFSKGQPVLFVEAKALDISIADHKAVTQVITYANVSGVAWALLTNGKAWDFYKVFASVQADQKRLFSVDVSDPKAAEWLRWITPARLAGNDLEEMWRHCFAERRLRALLTKMLGERDSDLVAFLAERSGLEPRDVTAGLHHLRVSFTEPEPRPPLIDAVPIRDQTAPAIRPRGEPKSRRRAIPRGQKPSRFAIGDRTWPIEAWREIQVRTCAFLAETRPEEFQRALDAPEFRGRRHRALSRSAETMRSPAEVPSGYVEVGLGATYCVALARRLLRFCGVDPASLRFETG